jgi:hypothetical protein
VNYKSIIVLLSLSNAIGSCENTSNSIQTGKLRTKSFNLKRTAWTSEVLDTSGRIYIYKFSSDSTYSLASKLPNSAIGLIEGKFVQDSNKIYFDDNFVDYYFVNLDTIVFKDKKNNALKLYRK